MGSIDNTTQAILRFSVPDQSVTADERSLFAPPANKEVKHLETPLHDARISEGIVKGPGGLDAQGFAYINHRSALSGEQWYTGRNVEDIYLPEVERLVCDVTGAKTAVVNNAAFRRRLADKQNDPTFVFKRGSEMDKELAKLPKDEKIVYGREEAGDSLEPARFAHNDYAVKGKYAWRLRDTARYARRDITAAAQRALDAEDALERGEQVEVPRYAAYSVWRPVKTVKRDPLAVCDWRSVDSAADVEPIEYRALSDITPDGEYITTAHAALPPKQPGRQRWYWMPEQKYDEVLIIKFADTAAEQDRTIAGFSLHCSPVIPGTEEEEPRCSIACSVLAFW